MSLVQNAVAIVLAAVMAGAKETLAASMAKTHAYQALILKSANWNQISLASMRR